MCINSTDSAAMAHKKFLKKANINPRSHLVIPPNCL